MTDGEKLDKFVDGLKADVRIEVLKSSAFTLEAAAQISLRVDGAHWRSSEASRFGGPGTITSRNGAATSSAAAGSAPTPMEISNMESTQRQKLAQRKKDRENNACYTCHKVGCRPYKHKKPDRTTVKRKRTKVTSAILIRKTK